MRDKFTLDNGLKQNPFAVPDGYFEQFVVKKSIVLNNELKQIPFTVPANYFDTLPAHVTESIAATPARPAIARWQVMRSQLAFAVSFVLLVGIGYGTFSILLRPAAPASIASENYADIPPDYLSNMVDEHTLLHAVASHNSSEAPQKISDDDIIQYLANSNVSVNDIAALY